MTPHDVAFEVNYHDESSDFLEEQSAALLSMYDRFVDTRPRDIKTTSIVSNDSACPLNVLNLP